MKDIKLLRYLELILKTKIRISFLWFAKKIKTPGQKKYVNFFLGAGEFFFILTQPQPRLSTFVNL